MKIKLPIRKPRPPLNRPPKLKLKASVARSRRAPIVEEEDFLEEPEPNMKLSHAFVVVLVLHVIAVAGVFAFNSIKAKQSDIFSAMKDESVAKAAATSDATVPETANASNGIASSAAAAPAAAPAVAAPSAAGRTHVLQPGETLTKVASIYRVSVADLQSINHIDDPTHIRAGTQLVIPGSQPEPVKTGSTYKPIAAAAQAAPEPVAAAPVAPKAAAPAAPAAAAGAKDTGNVYVVVKGDVPEKIAKKLNVSYADLMSINGNPDPRKLQIGQKLKIPATTK